MELGFYFWILSNISGSFVSIFFFISRKKVNGKNNFSLETEKLARILISYINGEQDMVYTIDIWYYTSLTFKLPDVCTKNKNLIVQNYF